jgi:hypothetical protein
MDAMILIPLVIGALGFSPNVTNPWFPLPPGTTFVYEGTEDGKHTVEYLYVSRQTQKIDGVSCRVVLDRLYLDGKLAETTRDYYTQDKAGNVWYFGEDTVELAPNGALVSAEGSWRSGVDGARAGIYISARPKLGRAIRQEYYPGQAEDYFAVADLSVKVTVPYGTFRHALMTKEWTPLEPDVLDHKFYVRGLGMVKEASVKGPVERLSLVEVRKPQ